MSRSGDGVVEVLGVPEHQGVEREAERAELVLLAFAVGLAQLPLVAVEDDPGDGVPAFVAVEPDTAVDPERPEPLIVGRGDVIDPHRSASHPARLLGSSLSPVAARACTVREIRGARCHISPTFLSFGPRWSEGNAIGFVLGISQCLAACRRVAIGGGLPRKPAAGLVACVAIPTPIASSTTTASKNT